MKVYEIAPRLYQRGHMRHLSAAVKLAELQRLGVGVVVNLTRRPDPDLPDMADFVYIQIPIPDNRLAVTTAVLLEETAERLAQFIARGTGVLVHCNAGRNRASLLTSLVLYRLGSPTRATAMRRVCERRPNALANPYFVEYLEDHL